jgi:hypothetical protein
MKLTKSPSQIPFPRSSSRRWSPRLAGTGRLALAAAAALSCATPAAEVQAGGGLASARGPYEVEVLLDGVAAPRFTHQGESYVMGKSGRRYTLRVWTRSARRVEAVVSVDGRDVIDGKPGDFRHKRGYLVPAWGSVDIDGWRLSGHQAAAFRFTSVTDSYAARMGSARNVGVIGVAVFPERAVPAYIAPRRSHRYPSPDDASEMGRDERQSAESGSAPPAAASPGPGGLADADGPRSRAASPERRRPGLGTEFGEAVSSSVHEVEFVRASAGTPELVLGLRYNDRRGLLALGIEVDDPRRGRHGDTWLRQSADPFPVSRSFASPPLGWRR